MKLIPLIFVLLFNLTSCGDKPMQINLKSLDSVAEENIEKLNSKIIFFGHQSVGFNIIDGIKDVMMENQNMKLNIVETSKPEDFSSPLFAHARVGQNLHPNSKTDSFSE